MDSFWKFLRVLGYWIGLIETVRNGWYIGNLYVLSNSLYFEKRVMILFMRMQLITNHLNDVHLVEYLILSMIN